MAQDPGLENLQAEVLECFDRFETSFDQVKQQVKIQIEQQQLPYFLDSLSFYEQHRLYRYQAWDRSATNDIYQQEKNIQMEMDRLVHSRLPITDVVSEYISNQIVKHCGWQNTTMILRPGTESWIHKMVSNDPVYLVDESHELLRPCMSQFNDAYQRRLRPYAVREDQNQDILWQLPDGQFGLVLAWNYFNHRPFEIIQQYLLELYKKMRPGGVLLMTYNDCDRWQGVRSVEYKTGSYTPGSIIQTFAHNLGFEQMSMYQSDGPWSWIEFQKPGTWQSARGGQALAKILPKPIAKSK
jgi:hypothetical protein